ncbi:hypothetical protein VE25_16840 [Devosia geojensis]|uniref:Uncharacterized protein n=1 Tax=Devosia geojensis TaxID=443610 RepID=A0A0F5FP62_9HYPH|nr:hypothetical protein [Devosia geojensis]KKB10669.1 hypothetical protein VE25_16840 [Devosia geojensis]
MPNFSETFRDFKASKTVLFWSCAGCIVATMVVGFTWGGWVTGGSAQERADGAAEQAVAQLAADICVNRYLASPDVRTNLTAFNAESVYRRSRVIEDGGWVTLADREKPISGAAKLCADQLAAVDLADLPTTPVADARAVPAVEATTVQ